MKLQHTRWKLTKIILILSSLFFILPTMVNFVLQFILPIYEPLVLLDATHWVTIVTLIVSLYTTSNVAQDYIFTKNGVENKKENVEEDEGD